MEFHGSWKTENKFSHVLKQIYFTLDSLYMYSTQCKAFVDIQRDYPWDQIHNGSFPCVKYHLYFVPVSLWGWNQGILELWMPFKKVVLWVAMPKLSSPPSEKMCLSLKYQNKKISQNFFLKWFKLKIWGVFWNGNPFILLLLSILLGCIVVGLSFFFKEAAIGIQWSWKVPKNLK